MWKKNRGNGFEKYRKFLEIRINYLKRIIPTLPEGFRKTRLIEQKKRIKFELRMISLTEETYIVLEQIVKLDKEYKELIEKQNNGEFVLDLINQNRYLVKSLHEQDKRNCEEFRQLKEKEQKRRLEKRKRDEEEAVEWLSAHPDIARTIPKKRKRQSGKKKLEKSGHSFKSKYRSKLK